MVTDLYKLSAKGGQFALLARQLQHAHEALDKIAAAAAQDRVRPSELELRADGIKTVAAYTALAVDETRNALKQRDVYGAEGCEELGLDPSMPYYPQATY